MHLHYCLFCMQKGNTSFDIANQYGHCSVMEELEKYTARQLVVIPFKDLDFKETVGKGTFGVVRKGYWTSSDRGRQLVAIKQVDAVDEKEVSYKLLCRWSVTFVIVPDRDFGLVASSKHH